MRSDPAVCWDPYDARFAADPYPAFARLREEAPLYYNEQYDFYAVSRFADVERGLRDWETFSSARGSVLELIKSGMQMPPGTLIFEDPGVHDVHRRLLASVFTPRRISALEPQVRDFCARALDPLAGACQFDLMTAVGTQVPMWVIGKLLGVPAADQAAIRDFTDDKLRTESGGQMAFDGGFGHELIADYIDWRKDHPSDDLMTELLHAEFEDEHGATRTLSRDEVLTYVTVIAGSVMMFIVAAANRDHRHYRDPDRFDIHRSLGQQLTFGLGIHYCLGAALARLEGRVAMEEILRRFPRFDVDWENAKLSQTSTVRGWESLPLVIS